MNLPTPTNAQTKFLLLSRSLQRRLSHFSHTCHGGTVQEPFAKLQAAVEAAAFNLFQVPTDIDAVTAMGLPHSLVRQQLCLPL